MTLSAVSMQMKALESELGTALFDRSFRPPRLTPAGRGILVHARTLLAAEEALFDLCAPHDRLSGRYMLGFVVTASVRLLPGFVGRARAVLPDVTFVFETGLSETLEARVLSGALDAAVVTAGAAPDPGLARHVVRHEPFAFAVHKALLRSDPRETVAQAPFLQFRPGTGIGRQVGSVIDPLKTGPRLVLDSVETIMECVRARLGATFLPRPDIEWYRGSDTALFDLPETTVSRRLALVTRRGDPLTAKAHLLTDLMGDGTGP